MVLDCASEVADEASEKACLLLFDRRDPFKRDGGGLADVASVPSTIISDVGEDAASAAEVSSNFFSFLSDPRV